MDAEKIGIWRLFMTGKSGEKTRKINGQWCHNISDTSNQCDGDVLFDYMTEQNIIEDWAEYDTDGDNEFVAIMHKTGDKPDYHWDFVENAPPSPASDDCHTYS